MKVVSFVNQKGGTGKTTACVNISAALALKGTKVLLIDLDPQANATLSLGFQFEPRALDVLLGRARIRDIIRETSREGLDIVPAGPDLAMAAIELQGQQGRLKQIIGDLEGGYDYIFIDCPPSLNSLTVNALAASNGLIIPILATYLSLEGLKQLLSTIDRARGHLNPGLEIVGILPNMVDARRNLTVKVLDILRKQFKDKVFKAHVPVCVALAESPSYSLDIFAYEGWSTGAAAYTELAKEFLKW